MKVLDIIKEVRESLEESDEEKALAVLKKYYGMVKLCDIRVEKILTGEEKELSAKAQTALVLYYRYLKRIFAHFINVADIPVKFNNQL